VICISAFYMALGAYYKYKMRPAYYGQSATSDNSRKIAPSGEATNITHVPDLSATTYLKSTASQ